MQRFLQETWELFYWALWCPSRFERMRLLAPGDRVSWSHHISDSLFFRVRERYSNLLLITVCLSLAIIPGIQQNPGTLDWLLLPLVWLITYSMALLYLPLAFSLPVLLAFSYGTQIDFWNTVIAIAPFQDTWPPLSAWIRGLGFGSLGIGLTSGLVYWCLTNQSQSAARWIFALGTTLNLAIETGLITQNMGDTIEIALIPLLVSILASTGINTDDDAFGFAGVFAGVVALSVAGVVLFGVAFGVMFVVVLSISFSVAGVVAGVVAFSVAGVVAGVVVQFVGSSFSIAFISIAFSVAGVVLFGVAFGVIGVLIGMTAFPPPCSTASVG